MPTESFPLRLEGKRILITAGASGMGRAGAELFARHGAVICIADYNANSAACVVEAVRAAGGQASALVADLTDMEQARHIVHEASERMGGLDGLWAHAGAPGPQGLENLDWNDYRRSMALNVDATVASVSEAIPLLRQGRKPSILMTASISGLVGSQLSPIYSLEKFAIVGFAKSLALALGSDGIRVNALCPGLVDTPMLPTFMSRSGDAEASRLAQEKFVASVPLGRVAQPEEQAHAALWLMSDEAAYITGIALPVDGGFTAR
ncbi:SDR family NAD(P)-dependent oxidoreductase [Allopusillimonas ginsengisoli]|uniref:SDR family NAD(P)-dependent oxidoreductase n=1 Tax=Allopusillimonas ginsengisoli TaxID=453575 RepID=UPI0010209221|nr:SDR family NAD(P)-dependent oxidoreductase [Allopusillimonas ginsengisoli]TEA76913.1 SDR family oxidoreductase [Allopusillimonas ginsengisoli]